MSIIRTKKKTGDFYIGCKEVPESSKLSWGAKGLHSYLMTKPDNWNVIIENLINSSSSGRDATRSVINELMRKGYITRKRKRNKTTSSNLNTNGSFAGFDYEVLEALVYKDFATDGKAVYGEAACGLSPTNNNNINNNNITNTNTNGQISESSTSDQKSGNTFVTAREFAPLSKKIIKTVHAAVSDKMSRWKEMSKMVKAEGDKKSRTEPTAAEVKESYDAVMAKPDSYWEYLSKRLEAEDAKKSKQLKSKTRSKNTQYTDEFEWFWQMCGKYYADHPKGRQDRGHKCDASREYQKLWKVEKKKASPSKLEQDHMFSLVFFNHQSTEQKKGLVAKFTADTKWLQGIGIPYVSTFLHKRMWEEEICEAEQGGFKKPDDPNAKYANIIPSDQR